MKISVVIPIGPKRKLHAFDSLKRQIEPVELIVEEGKNPSANRNRGIERARGEIIAFIDAHSILPVDWSKKLRIFFDKHKEIDVVGGPQLTPSKQNFFARVSGYALSSVFGAAEVSNRYNTGRFLLDADEKYLTSANLACRRKVLKKVKFDENIYPGEDPKFIADAKKIGFKVAYDPNIIVYHKRRDNPADFAKQIFNYGRTRPKKEGLFETIQKPSFLVPSLFAVYLTVFSIFSLFNSLFLMPILLYVVLSIIFSLHQSIKNNDAAAFFILPFIFFTIHIVYGLGFLYGLIARK